MYHSPAPMPLLAANPHAEPSWHTSVNKCSLLLPGPVCSAGYCAVLKAGFWLHQPTQQSASHDVVWHAPNSEHPRPHKPQPRARTYDGGMRRRRRCGALLEQLADSTLEQEQICLWHAACNSQLVQQPGKKEAVCCCFAAPASAQPRLCNTRRWRRAHGVLGRSAHSTPPAARPPINLMASSPGTSVIAAGLSCCTGQGLALHQPERM